MCGDWPRGSVGRAVPSTTAQACDASARPARRPPTPRTARADRLSPQAAAPIPGGRLMPLPRGSGVADGAGGSSLDLTPERPAVAMGGGGIRQPCLVPAIPTAGLGRSGGIIPVVRINGTLSVSLRTEEGIHHIPNVGMARTISQILAIQLLGHRRTCHTSPTGPMVRLNPATGTT